VSDYQANAHTRVLLFGWTSCKCTGIAERRFGAGNVCFEEKTWTDGDSSLMQYLQCKEGEHSYHSFVYFRNTDNTWGFNGVGFAYAQATMSEEKFNTLVTNSGAEKTCHCQAPPPAPATAPVVAAPRPTAQPKDAHEDTNLGGSGHDAYSIINIESKRALYAISLGITDADTTFLGASTRWAGSAEQNWRVESAGARNGVETWRITNDVNERRLYALEGTEGPDGKTGVGATASVYAGGDEELWFIISTTGDNTNVGFQFKNVLSNRYLFANSDEHEDAGFGATATPAGKNVDWMMRVQSRALIDGSTVELFHHSFLGGTDGTTEFCIVAETGDSVECNGAGPATSFAKFQFDSVDKASNSWSIKSLALNKYCTAGVAMTCNAITVGAGETFVVEKRPYGALSMKHGELNCKPSPTGISCTAALATDYDNFEARCSNNCADVESLEVKFALSKPVLAANGGTSALPFICGVLLLSFVGGLVYRRLGSERHTSAGFREVELLVE